MQEMWSTTTPLSDIITLPCTPAQPHGCVLILHAGINQFSAQGYVAEMRYINGDSGDLPNAKIPPLRDGEASTCDLLLRLGAWLSSRGQNNAITHGLRSPACTFGPVTSIHFLI